MSSPYAMAAERAAEDCAQWLRDHPEAPRPPDVWAAPKDCPLWNAGLSAFQAGWAWAKAKELAPPPGSTPRLPENLRRNLQP